jgi:hypothetical protein
MLGKYVGFETRDLAVSVETSEDFSCHIAMSDISDGRLLLRRMLDAQNWEC